MVEVVVLLPMQSGQEQTCPEGLASQEDREDGVLQERKGDSTTCHLVSGGERGGDSAVCKMHMAMWR